MTTIRTDIVYTDDDLAELFFKGNKFPLFACIAHEQSELDTIARIYTLRVNSFGHVILAGAK